ncbi:MAG: type II toxin-antitoxin system RelE/ParE family toxin [bacterium]
MSYAVTLLRDAQKALDKMDEGLYGRLIRAMRLLEADPRHSGVVKMSGGDDLYRVRVGDWRIVYAIRDNELIVIVIRIGHRREVYR